MAGCALNYIWYRSSEGIYYYEIEIKICHSIMYFVVQPLDMVVSNMLHLKVNYEQKTIFINATCVGIRICRLILHIPNYLTVETKYILFVVVGNYRKLCLPESY